MARKEKQVNEKKEIKQATKINQLFNDTMDNISYQVTGGSNENRKAVDDLNNKITNIIKGEINNTKSITSDEMSTFLVKLYQNDDMSGFNKQSLDDIFGEESSQLLQFFQERYKNENLLYDDLEMIVKQLFELEEAIMSTRDAIITADDMTKTVSRTIDFDYAADAAEKSTYIKTIERVETEHKLLKKLKNQVIPGTLKYGKYYVYCVPYTKLFEQQYASKMKLQQKQGTLESCTIQLESSEASEFAKELNTKMSDEKLIEAYNKCAGNIKIYNDVFSIPLLEGVDISELMDIDKFRKKTDIVIKDTEKKTKRKFADGVTDTAKKVEGMFDNVVNDVYLKFIDPKQIIPIKILDTTIGYYYLRTTTFQMNRSPFSSAIQISTNGVSSNGLPKENIENLFLSNITDKIVKAFDKPFLEKNVKFKDLILNALQYNDMYNKQIDFQFIPRDYIVEFKVNEDENDEGQSILKNSLFYAKLYLALLIFKMISIITRSNDQRVYYIKNSGIDSNIVNAVQNAARSIKERQINFTDLLNYNSIVSKIGQYKEIFMPVGRSGDKGIDFDILSGQDVQLNTDLMDMLRTNMINSTGVPSVIMNYVNEADYAKTLVMANSKFLLRVVSYQLDFNPSITELYKKILTYSETNTLNEQLINSLIVTLNTPKSLNTMNISDILSNTDQLINNMIKAKLGDNSDQTEKTNFIRDHLYAKVLRDYLPMLPWTRMDELYDECELEWQQELQNKDDENME